MVNNKYINLVLGLSLVSALLIMSAGGNIKWQSFVALSIIAILSFFFPLLGVVLIIPVTLIAYIKNYKNLVNYWAKVKSIQIS